MKSLSERMCMGCRRCSNSRIRYNATTLYMSFLFHHRTKKVVKYIWMVVAVLIIISMVIFFAPGLLPF